MNKKPLIDAFGSLVARMHGGRPVTNQFWSQGITTQTFNKSAVVPADTALVFVPGFASVPTLAAPGVLKEAAHAQGWDFIRFYHPQLACAPDRLTYSNMATEAVQVIADAPQPNIVLVASSFGAGLLPKILDEVDEHCPGKVAGVLACNPVGASTLMDLFKRQPGYDEFLAAPHARLKVSSPTLPAPFVMSRAQHDSVDRALDYRLDQPFTGPVHVMIGAQDPLQEKAAPVLNPADAPAMEVRVLPQAGHKFPALSLYNGVTNLAVQLRKAQLI